MFDQHILPSGPDLGGARSSMELGLHKVWA